MKKNKLKFETFEEVFPSSQKTKVFCDTYDEETVYIKLARQIRQMRVSQKMTQKVLAKKADMPQSVIARIESGVHSFSLGTLHRLARAFDKEVQFA